MDTAILQEFEAIGVDLESESLGKCEKIEQLIDWTEENEGFNFRL